MESFVEWGYLGLFLSSFLGATIIPLSSEIVLSLLIAQGFEVKNELGGVGFAKIFQIRWRKILN